jgi:hypothetical protein
MSVPGIVSGAASPCRSRKTRPPIGRSRCAARRTLWPGPAHQPGRPAGRLGLTARDRGDCRCGFEHLHAVVPAPRPDPRKEHRPAVGADFNRVSRPGQQLRHTRRGRRRNGICRLYIRLPVVDVGIEDPEQPVDRRAPQPVRRERRSSAIGEELALAPAGLGDQQRRLGQLSAAPVARAPRPLSYTLRHLNCPLVRPAEPRIFRLPGHEAVVALDHLLREHHRPRERLSRKPLPAPHRPPSQLQVLNIDAVHSRRLARHATERKSVAERAHCAFSRPPGDASQPPGRCYRTIRQARTPRFRNEGTLRSCFVAGPGAESWLPL